MKEQAQRLHKENIVIDGLNCSKIDEQYIEKMNKGGLTAIHETVQMYKVPASFFFGFKETFSVIADFYDLVQEFQDSLMLGASARDIETAKKQGKIAVVLGFQSPKAMEDDLRYVQIFQRLGVRIVQLTYNEKNFVGDGCGEKQDGGLSKFGRRLIAEFNKQHILIDLSHCGPRTTLESIEESKDPVAITHSNAIALCNRPRNKSDEAIKLLAEKGGVIGVTAFSPFVSDAKKLTIDTLIDHVDYIEKLVGADHIAFGSDFTEGRTQEDYYHFLGAQVRYNPETIEPYPWNYPKDIEGVVDLTKLTEKLLERGYSKDEVVGIIGENWLRLYRKVWGG